MCEKVKIMAGKLPVLLCLGLGLIFLLRCNIEGPEPNDPVFPAQIDLGDSAAIRAILDSNNLRKIGVRQAIGKYEDGRIRYFNLDSMGLDSFSFTADFSKLDSLHSIDLSGNNISVISVSDSIKFNQLYELTLDNNLLTSFPLGILRMSGISTIYLEYNLISSIPQELVQSRDRHIFLDHNKLCSVADTSVINWLDSLYGADWKSRQDCP